MRVRGGKRWKVRTSGITGPRCSECVSTAASPNSATRSRSSSDAIFNEPDPESVDNIGCSRTLALLADPTESGPLFKTFRNVVTWKPRRTHEALHSPKRRKVRLSTRIRVSAVHAHVCIGSTSHVRRCGTCRPATPRPFVCLDCAFSGCWQDDHIVEHFDRRKTQILCVYLCASFAPLSNRTQASYSARNARS